MRRDRALILLLPLAAALAVGAHSTNSVLESRVQQAAPTGDVGVLPNGRVLRVLSLGLDRLVADLFWLRTAYYVGDEHSEAAGYPSLARLAELVTDVDPTFRTVYVVMSGAISALQGDPGASISLLEKGIRNVEYWKLHFLLGFSYFIETLEYDRAAEQMQLAAAKGGPSYLALLATRLYANAGDQETAIAFIRARLAEERDEGTRQALTKRYVDLWITRDLERIDAGVRVFRQREGRDPASVQELVQAGLIQSEPRDPRGGPYRIQNGQAVSDVPHDSLELNRPYKPTAADIQAEYEQMRKTQDEGGLK